MQWRLIHRAVDTTLKAKSTITNLDYPDRDALLGEMLGEVSKLFYHRLGDAVAGLASPWYLRPPCRALPGCLAVLQAEPGVAEDFGQIRGVGPFGCLFFCFSFGSL